MKVFQKCACLWLLVGMAASVGAQEKPQPVDQQALKQLEAIKAEEAALVAKQAFIDAHHAPQAKMEKVPYCGVSTEEVMPALAAQLKLARGMGLLVNLVEPKSPAEIAGIKQYDVLVKFNDQLLTNPEQLRVLVRMKLPSDDVKFAIIRQGQPAEANVELGQKEMEVQVEAAAMPPQPFIFNNAHPNAPFMINDRAFNVVGGGGGGGMAFTNVNTNGKNQMVVRDAQNTLSLELKDGKAVTLKATDRDGNEIFDGPVENESQRKALPAGLADKLQKAEAGGPFRFPRVRTIGARAPVLTSTEGDTLMVARFDKQKAVYVFAFSTADGKTLFDGPTVTDEERKALPDAAAKQLKSLEENQAAAAEFGVIGRN